MRKRFIQRGGEWVIVQFVLLLAVAILDVAARANHGIFGFSLPA